eukprot:jgi/Mesvir1/16108/Mv08396-RA.3
MSTKAAEVTYSWVAELEPGKPDGITYCHMVTLAKVQGPSPSSDPAAPVLAAAWQASTGGHEGTDLQHLRFSLSHDQGNTWSPSKPVMWGLAAVWSPVLHCDEPSGRLFLFYSVSRKARSPGGDIQMISTADLGNTWSDPVIVYAHEADGGVPKVLANRLCVLRENGRWVLPFWREPPHSYLEYAQYHPLKEAAPTATARMPPGAPPESRRGSAGALISDDRGQTWRACGNIHNKETWLIENTVEQCSDGRLLMLFRSGQGCVFQSLSGDGGETWQEAVPIHLPNPNSKLAIATFCLPPGHGKTGKETALFLAYNHSTQRRSPLNGAISLDDGATWRHLAYIEEDVEGGNFAYPTPIGWAPGVVMVGYSSWGKGIRLATLSISPDAVR